MSFRCPPCLDITEIPDIYLTKACTIPDHVLVPLPAQAYEILGTRTADRNNWPEIVPMGIAQRLL